MDTMVKVPDDISSLAETTPPPTTTTDVWAQRVFAAARLSIGWVFLWAFVDKLFGLGFATERADSWLNGGSPTNGFLSFGTTGPFADFYQSIAGAAWADWLFMTGLAAIGLALTLGIATRIAAVAGSVLLVMMWTAVLAPANNPFMDDHLVYAIVLIGLALTNAGDTWGFGRIWAKQPIVTRYPALR